MNVLQRIQDTIIEPLILLFVALGFLVFIYGVVEYIWGLSTDTKAKELGKQHILWGILGMFVMAGAFGLFKLMVRILGAPVNISDL